MISTIKKKNSKCEFILNKETICFLQLKVNIVNNKIRSCMVISV